MLPRQTNAYYTFLRFDTTGRAANRKVERWRVASGRLPAPTAPILQQAINRATNLNEADLRTINAAMETFTQQATSRV